VNPITPKLTSGTFGELYAQFRLLQFGVQAAAPLKDSGNDLIAARGRSLRAISVWSPTGNPFNKPPKKRLYDILAVVAFSVADGNLSLDASQLFLVPHEAVIHYPNRVAAIQEFLISDLLVDALFP
jgi:hypothetical protein